MEKVDEGSLSVWFGRLLFLALIPIQKQLDGWREEKTCARSP
jgi:hypothetical protein